MSDRETLDLYDQRAGDYAAHFGYDKPSKSLARFIDHLPHGAAVLDLGCGPGDSAALMRDAGFNVDAVDASQGMIDQANHRFGLNARLATFDDITGRDIYDAVWANFSLLHAPRADFPRYLSALHSAIKSGGLFHIGTKLKTTEPEARDKIGRFYTYYDEAELISHLKDAGFDPIDIHKGHEVGLSGSDDPFILVLTRA